MDSMEENTAKNVTESATDTAIVTETGADSDSERETDSVDDIDTDADSQSIPEGGTDRPTDTGATETDPDIDTDTDDVDTATAADVGPGITMAAFGMTSGSIVSSTTHYSLNAFLGGGPVITCQSANYRITAGIGEMTNR